MIVSETGGGSFPQAPIGLEPARCYGVVDIGTHANNIDGKKSRQLVLMFELTDAKIEDGGDHDGEPFRLSMFYTASLHEKAKLRKHLESWRGREFTPEELAGFDLNKLLGAPCTLNLVTKNEKTRIDSVMAVRKGEKVAPITAPLVSFGLADFDAAVFASLPEWLQKKIQESPEYKAVNGKLAAPNAPPAGDVDDIDPDGICPF